MIRRIILKSPKANESFANAIDQLFGQISITRLL